MTDFADLVTGYHRFRQGDYVQQHERWETLATGQSPKVMVIACSDSRVDPAQIFDVAPGEIFVVRNIAALVPPFETGGGHHGVAAALEFAVTQLSVPEIVVMGHGACGGVKAALARSFAGAEPGEGGFIASGISLLDAPRDRIAERYGDGPEAIRPLELEAVRTSVENLRTFPFIAERETTGALRLHGANFSIADGVLHVMDAQGEFAPA